VGELKEMGMFAIIFAPADHRQGTAVVVIILDFRHTRSIALEEKAKNIQSILIYDSR